jgi:hypothetical protein
MNMTKTARIGDTVFISPDLTGQTDWSKGTVIDVENNSFVGVVITAKAEQDGDIFFGRDHSFKL